MNYNKYKETFELSCQIDIDKLSEIYLKTFGHKENGYFVECGAYDGKMFSNTYGLSILGWHGLYIEPVPHLMLECKRNHAFNLNIQYFDKPIGKEYVENIPFYPGDWASSLCEDVVNANPHLDKNRFFMTSVYPLDYVLDRYSVPYGFDLIIIDTEGNDRQVLEGFSIQKYYPKLVIVEYNQNYLNWFMDYFKENNYTFIFRDDVNLIFKREF